MQKWIKYIFKITIEFDPQMILFHQYRGQGRLMINMMILVAKQYIYSAKCLNQTINFMQYSQRLAKVYSLEKSVAIRQDKENKHNKKWYLYCEI